MAQAGYTPIQLYFSTTAAAVPTSGNLANGELGINIQDEKLYFKNAAGTVKLLASNATSAPVLTFSAGTTGFTPSSATSGAITLAGTLATTNGGTGLTAFTANQVFYASSTSAFAQSANMTFNGTTLTVAGLSNTGNTILGDAAADSVTVNGTVTSNLIFTDNTYDIGASGATRPRDLFLSRNLTVGGTLTLAGGVNLNGNVTVGDSSADTLTINSTITSNLIFTDNTYDIGASGATRPRNLYLAGLLTMGGALTVNGNTTLGDATTDTVKVNGYMGIGGSTPLSYVALYITNSALTGTGQNGVYSAPTANSTATSSINAFVGDARTDATAFTVTNARQFFAANFTKGAGSTITNAMGYYVEDMTTGTNNYGLYSTVTSGTNKFNIYASGSAQNFFAGNVGMGESTPTNPLTVRSTGNATYSSAKGIVLDHATSSTSVIVPIGFSWSSSISNQNPYWGMGFIPTNYAGGNGELGFYVGAVEKGRFTASGVAITGTMSTTGLVSLNGANLPASTSLAIAGAMCLGASSATTGDYLSSGGGNSSTYNGIAILSNSRGIATQANTGLPSWIVDVGGRAADGSTYNVATANKFRVAYVAAGGSYYSAADFFAITSAGNVGINNISPTVRFEATGGENEALTMTSLSGAQGAISYNQGEIRECGFNVNNASNTVISDITTTSTGWRVVFRGTWSNNYEGSGLTFYAPYIELNAANPSTPIGSRTLTVSRNGSGFLIVNSSDANRISFAGTVEVYENPQSLQPVQSMRLLGGIQFPATQNATSQANTLDDYEEGTWTPEIQIGGSSTGITYSSRGGYYRKIGSTVFCTAQIQLSSKGSNTGDLTLNGFPFTTDGATASRGGGSFNYFHSTPALTNAGSLFLLVESSDTRSVLRYYNTSTGLSVALSQANVNNTTEFFFTFTYIAAS